MTAARGPSGGGARGSAAATAATASLVAAGGAVGALGRALLENALPAASGAWPWTTFTVNVVGSLVLGALLETLLRSGPDRGRRRLVRLGCGTGLLGGFTTYSSFAVEVVRLAQDGHAAVGAAYALVSVLAGVLAALAGILGAGAAHRRRRARRGGAA